jgi:hypothetical protein
MPQKLIGTLQVASVANVAKVTHEQGTVLHPKTIMIVHLAVAVLLTFTSAADFSRIAPAAAALSISDGCAGGKGGTREWSTLAAEAAARAYSSKARPKKACKRSSYCSTGRSAPPGSCNSPNIACPACSPSICQPFRNTPAEGSAGPEPGGGATAGSTSARPCTSQGTGTTAAFAACGYRWCSTVAAQHANNACSSPCSRKHRASARAAVSASGAARRAATHKGCGEHWPGSGEP